MKHRSSADRINPDSIHTLWFTVILVGFLAIASFMVSFTGLRDVAAWAGIPEWLRWAVPVFIDVAILAYTMAVLIHRSRGEKVWPSWVSLAGFTAFSMMANAAHAIALDHPNMWQRSIGASIAALAPVAVFAATEQLGRLVIRSPLSEQVVGLALPVVDVGGPTPPKGGEPVPEVGPSIEDAQETEVESSFDEVITGAGFFKEDELVEEPAGEPAVVMESVSPVRENADHVVVEAASLTEDTKRPVAPTDASLDGVPVMDAVDPVGAKSVPGESETEERVVPSLGEETVKPMVLGPRPFPKPLWPVTRPSESGVALPVRDERIRPVQPISTVTSFPQRRSEPVRPALSVVREGVRSEVQGSALARWVTGEVAAGRVPTGKSAAVFLKVSERTGRTRLNELKSSSPSIFEPFGSKHKAGGQS